MLFWASIALVGVTIVLAIPAIYYLRQGRLGEVFSFDLQL